VNQQVWWYVTRSSGIVAWLALTASVLWGVMLSTKAFSTWRRPAWLLDMHRWLAGLTLAFVAVHIAALVADSYVEFDLLDVTVPFASDWKPLPVALGIMAMWLLVAIELTSLAMKRLPKRVWRGVHLASYLVFWLTSIHAALAGTDPAQRLYQATAVIMIGAVAWATTYRVLNRRSIARSRTRPDRDPVRALRG
jgi:DMSO/TMAO reductase YedYZ heme-binding membrane subunit